MPPDREQGPAPAAGTLCSVPTRILLVEDDAASRDAISSLLRDFSFDVVCASDGAEALRAAGGAPPDAIVLDLLMPVMTGFEFLERKRLDARLAGTPVVLMTSATPVGAAVRGIALPPGVRLLVKPFEAQELLVAVRKALGGAGPSRHAAPG